MSSNYAIDPELARDLSSLPRLGGHDLHEMRQQILGALSLLPTSEPDGVSITHRDVPGLDGEPPVPVIVYRPHRETGRACVLDVHGGGFTMGTAAMNQAANLRIASRLGVTVVSVDYRLAPEHPYPAALNDCDAALHWVQAGAYDSLTGSVTVALHGFSAGAGLCAALSLRTRDRGGPDIAFQYLGSPVLDDRLDSPSMRRFTDTPMWDRHMASASWTSYLGGTDSPYAVPARAEDLSNLPPTYVSVMTFDPLRDEGIAYVQRLLEDRVPTELHLFPGTFHGSNLLHRAAISRRETAERMDVLRHALFPSSAR